MDITPQENIQQQDPEVIRARLESQRARCIGGLFIAGFVTLCTGFSLDTGVQVVCGISIVAMVVLGLCLKDINDDLKQLPPRPAPPRMTGTMPSAGPIMPSQACLPREHVPAAVRSAVFRRYNGACADCGTQTQLQIDHIIPLSKGGSNELENLQILCAPCNRLKSNKI